MPDQIFKVCPHCEERVSPQLRVCPKCGFRFKTTSKFVWVCLFVIFVMLMIVTFNQVLKGTTLYSNLTGDPMPYQQDSREEVTGDVQNIIYAFSEEGVIVRMEAAKNTIYVERQKWAALNSEEKEMLAASGANVFALQNKNERITADIVDAVSHQPKAHYDDAAGLKIF